MKIIRHFSVMAILLSLAACSNNVFGPNGIMSSKSASSGGTQASGGEVGGNMRSQMDEIDRSKLYHALDGALGKSTHWENPTTGIAYTVTPVEKTSVGDNQICRKYTIDASKNGRQETYNGTACVGQDGNWSAS